MYTARQLISLFSMQPHPEGGYYAETFQSTEWVSENALPGRFTDERKLYSVILYLLEQGDYSAFHRLKSDECWHFYAGGRLQLVMLFPSGFLQTIYIGNNPLAAEHFQFVVPAGCWFAAAPASGTVFTLTGCTMSPGFAYDDFELADRSALTRMYPQHEAVIRQYTR